MLSLFRNEGAVDPDIVFTLLRDDYGFEVDEIELYRDFRTLADLGLIGVDETEMNWRCLPESEFWPLEKAD